MKVRTLLVLAGAWSLLVTSPSALAGVIPGRWDKVDRLETGTPIVIVLKSGETLEARFSATKPDSLVFKAIDGTERQVPKAEVEKVTRAEKTRDSLTNGLLIGSAVGFAVGFGGLAIFNAHETASGPIWDGEAVSYYAGAGLLGGLIGALAGMGIDSAVKTQEELYRAP